MNTRAFTTAIIVACLAMFMVHTYIDDQKSSLLQKYGKDATVVVAKEDLKELELLDDTKVRVITVPKNFVQPGAFVKVEDLQNTMATTPIAKGEQITKPRVTYPGAKTGLSRQVSPDKRAFALNIDEQQAVGKLIKPGDRVDIMAPVDYSSGRKDKQKVKTILQDVLILSTGKSMTNALPIYGVKTPKEIRRMNANVYDRYNTVTLELSPYEVQRLIFLINYSGHQPYLALRNNNDQKQVRIRSTDIFDVLGEDEQAEARAYFQDLYKKKGGR